MRTHQGCHVGGMRQTFTEVAVAMSSATFMPVIRASELMAVPPRLVDGFELCGEVKATKMGKAETHRTNEEVGAESGAASLF